MKKVSKKDNVKKIILQNQDFYYRIDNKIFKNNIVVMDLENDFFGDFYIHKNEIIVQSFYGDIIYKDKKYDGYYNYLNDNEFTYLNSNDDNLYLVDENNIDRKLNIEQNFYQYKKYCIIIDKNQIILKNLENPNPLWHYDLGTKYNYFKEADYQGEPPVEVQAEVIKFLGVYKNELWLVLNSGLLALNIETGTETRYIKEGKMAVGEPFFEDFKGYFGYDTVLDEEKGIIFSLNLYFYIEYDLNANKNHFDSYSFKASSDKNGLHLNHIGGYDTENIYAYEGSDNNRFAIFSREKKEIIWSEEIPEAEDKFPAIRDLQYGAGKIYVLDHYNTLHIFEEEK